MMLRYKLKRYHINDILPGMEIGKVVLTDDGMIALGEGTVLSASLIERLRTWGVSYLEIREIVPDETAKLFLPNKQEVAFHKEYKDTIGLVKHIFDTGRYFKKVPLEQIWDLTSMAVEPLVESLGVINHLQMIKTNEDYTLQHSLNVGIISGIIGKWLGYADSQITNLILAGILHDIGKTQVPLEILNKRAKLSNEEMQAVKMHAVRGYQLIKDNRELDVSIGYGILQHHERIDGSGYPLGINGDKIHQFAKIIAIADVYDAMTSDRVYQTKVAPFTVAETLMRDMYGKFDPNICAMFLNTVRDYFIGNIVELSDGREAEIIYLGHHMGARPVVRTQDGTFIDLEKEKSLVITKLIRA